MLETNLPIRAEPLLNLFVSSVQEKFNKRVISTFKIGSLGSHGDFSLCSDVDVVLMLDKIQDNDPAIILQLWDDIKGANLEYADRLSIFWSCYDKSIFGQGLGRFPPLDRLDFIRYGVLLTGIDRRAELPVPEQKDLIFASAEFITSFLLTKDKLEKLIYYPEKIAAQGARYFTKFVLFPVRLIFTLDYPDAVGSNRDAVEHYNRTWINSLPAAAEIINMAFRLRNTPANNPVLIDNDKLRVVLLALYKYCIMRYQATLLALNEEGLVQQLETLIIPLNKPLV